MTVPLNIRRRLGFLPLPEVEFELVGDHALIRKAKHTEEVGVRRSRALDALRTHA